MSAAIGRCADATMIKGAISQSKVEAQQPPLTHYELQGSANRPAAPPKRGCDPKVVVRAGSLRLPGGRMPLFTQMPRRGLLGNPYSEWCIAPVRYVYPLSRRRTGAIGDVGQKGAALRVSKLIE